MCLLVPAALRILKGHAVIVALWKPAFLSAKRLADAIQ